MSFLVEIEKHLGLPESNRLKYEPLLPSSSEIGRLLSAFSNTDGGILVLGMLNKNKKISVTGLSDDFQVDVVLTNTISKLSPIPVIEYGFIQHDGKKLFAIKVEKSDQFVAFNESRYQITAGKIQKLEFSNLIGKNTSQSVPSNALRLNKILKYIIDNPGLINISKHTVRETIFNSQISVQDAAHLIEQLQSSGHVKTYGGRYIGISANTKEFFDSGNYVTPLLSENTVVPVERRHLFISYNWMQKTTANRLYDFFKLNGFRVSMDDHSLAYKDRISKFMESIRECDFAIIIISDQYLKSENCMTEIMHLLNDRHSLSKLLPIRQEDVKIFKSQDRIKYVKFWKQQVEEKEALLTSIESTSAIEEIRKLKTAKRIYQDIGDFLSEIADMITSTIEEQEKIEFKDIIEYVNRT